MKKTKLAWSILTIIPILLIIIGYIFPLSFFGSQEAIREFVDGFGVFAPITFVMLQIVQVIVTPISHYTVSIAGGVIFGLWPGFIYNYFGRVIGTVIAFYLGRKFGRRMVKHVVSLETLQKYDGFINRSSVLVFLFYFMPLFPDDEISYVAGFSAIKPRIFLPLMIIGHLSGSLSLAYIGSGIRSIREPLFIILSIITLIGGMGIAWHYRKIARSIPKKA